MDKPRKQAMKRDEAVKFLVDLVNIVDPARWPAYVSMEVTDKLGQLIDVENSVRVAKQLKDARSNPIILKPVLDIVRKLASAAADHKRTDTEIEMDKPILVFDGTRMGGDLSPVSWDGQLQDIVAVMAAGHLSKAETWQIGRCKRKECGRLFLAGRKGQTFCSHKCAGKVSSARYKQKVKSHDEQAKKRSGGTKHR